LRDHLLKGYTLNQKRLAANAEAFPFVMPGELKAGRVGDKLHKLAEVIDKESPEALYKRLISHWDTPSSVVLNSHEPPTIISDKAQWADMDDFTLRMMYLDTMTYLPDDILVKVDRAAMGVSLETRVPFLDHNVVEFAWRLPLSLKVRNGQGKWILRQVLYKYVPAELIERPKMGFGVPIDTWLRGPLREWAEELLSESRLRQEGYFNHAPIRQKWTEHLSGKRNWQYHLWDILMFQSWLEN
jgi:asparagine synthase (glutamine-hydrolysing)